MRKNYFLLPFSLIKKYFTNLAEKWNWGVGDFVIIFCVFSVTGMSVMHLRAPFQEFIWGEVRDKSYYIGRPIIFIVLYYIILNILGLVVGKSKFFLSMSTRPLKRLKFLFLLLWYLLNGFKQLLFHGTLDDFRWHHFSKNFQKNHKK